MSIQQYLTLTHKDNELRLHADLPNPDAPLYITDGLIISHENGSETNISGRYALPITGADGTQFGYVFLCETSAPIYDVSKNTLERYVLSTFIEFNVALYVTYQPSIFYALIECGKQCALIPPISITASLNHKIVGQGIGTILQSGFSDVRLIVTASELESANASVSDTSARVFLYIDSPACGDPEYTAYILKSLEDKTVTAPVDENAENYDAWRLPVRFGDKIKTIVADMNNPLITRRAVASAAYTYALSLSVQCSALYSIGDIRNIISVPRIGPGTVESIIKRLMYSINSRKSTALSAVRVPTWENHNHTYVDTLAGVSIGDGLTIITAPTASGKTKDVIIPFAAYAKNNGTFLAVAPLISLIDELARKLKTAHYSQIKSWSEADVVDSMSICLPSIKSQPLKTFVARADHLAIDEISQNVRFTASTSCNVGTCNSEDVYMELKKLISESKRVVVADASIDVQTLDFLERARPNEKFNVIDMPPKNTGRKCIIYEDMSDLIEKIYIELATGGRVWIAVESAKRAAVFEQILSKQYNVLMINSTTRGRKKQQQFSKNAEVESKLYDVVIASPTISSGISVEHHGAHHFTMIAGVASGVKICPSDFMQMLARVRYVPDYHVCLMANNISDDKVTAEAILSGQRIAAALEGKSVKENEYSLFKAQNDVNSSRFRSDFANGFYWIVEYFKFNIERVRATGINDDHKIALKTTSDEIKAKHIELLKNAMPIDHETADGYSINAINEEQSIQLEAYKIRKSLGYDLIHVLSDTDIEMRDHILDMDRINKYHGLTAAYDDTEKNIALRSFDRAQVIGYQMLFDGVRVDQVEFDQDIAGDVINRVIENRFLLSSLGLIPRKYAQWDENKRTGILKPYSAPKDNIKALNQIVQYLGVSLRATRKQVDKTRGRTYAINADEWALICSYAERRFNG